MKKFERSFSLKNDTSLLRRRLDLLQENIAAVREGVSQDPNTFIGHRS